ncbi:MAG: hypothetical protein ACFFF4_01250 [Candidatus Thorarchaeota archaeon]
MLLIVSPSDSDAITKNDNEQPTIVFDYSHGQDYRFSEINQTEVKLRENLTEMGYNIIWARGGLNSTILDSAVGLLVGSIFGDVGFSEYEINVIADWFNGGRKFLWVGSDNDFLGTAINDNMSLILESVSSHVYPENLQVDDLVYTCEPGFGYRMYTPLVGNDSYIENIVDGVENVLMHGPTILYGSDAINPAPGLNPVSLETDTIQNVFPLLYYSSVSYILTALDPNLYAHEVGEIGPFVACTLEMDAGESGKGVLIVSGASPYGDYAPMYQESYYSADGLDGHIFVKQAIQFGIEKALEYPGPFSFPMELVIMAGIALLGIASCVLAKRFLGE